MGGFWEAPAAEDLSAWRQAQKIGSFSHTITHNRYIVSVFTGQIDKAPEGYRWRRQLHSFDTGGAVHDVVLIQFIAGGLVDLISDHVQHERKRVGGER